MAGTIKNPAASIRQRLLNHARQQREEYQRTLTRFAIERLLFRLSRTDARQNFILKGAMLFVTWPQHVFRPTGDLDLLGHGDPDPVALLEVFKEICSVEASEDALRFDPALIRIDPVRDAERYQGARLTLKADLAGAIIPLQVDIGFGDHVYPDPKAANFPALLTGLPQANILMYPPESVVAEKFEAMMRFGLSNTRIKDFHDIWVTTRIFSFDLSTLHDAIVGTFNRRGTPLPTSVPVALTETFAARVEDGGLWTGFLRRNPPSLVAASFSELQMQLRHFFAPISAGAGGRNVDDTRWDPIAATWF